MNMKKSKHLQYFVNNEHAVAPYDFCTTSTAGMNAIFIERRANLCYRTTAEVVYQNGGNSYTS